MSSPAGKTSFDPAAMRRAAGEIRQLMDDMSPFDKLAGLDVAPGAFDTATWLGTLLRNRRDGIVQHGRDLHSTLGDIANQLETAAWDLETTDRDNSASVLRLNQDIQNLENTITLPAPDSPTEPTGSPVPNDILSDPWVTVLPLYDVGPDPSHGGHLYLPEPQPSGSPDPGDQPLAFPVVVLDGLAQQPEPQQPGPTVGRAQQPEPQQLGPALAGPLQSEPRQPEPRQPGPTVSRRPVTESSSGEHHIATTAAAYGYSAPGEPGMGEVAPSGEVSDWIHQAIGVLQANGVPVSDAEAQAIATIIAHESSGNPDAINLTDSNAAAGHPSIGLMQCIAPTFNAYKLPGHDSITNPVDNIIAGVRYALSRYGSLSNVPGIASLNHGGSYVGY